MGTEKARASAGKSMMWASSGERQISPMRVMISWSLVVGGCMVGLVVVVFGVRYCWCSSCSGLILSLGRPDGLVVAGRSSSRSGGTDLPGYNRGGWVGLGEWNLKLDSSIEWARHSGHVGYRLG